MHGNLSIAAVIVTFNRKDLLKENIKMLLAQDEHIDSIIIVDNHSTDGTEKEIESFFADCAERIDYNYLSKNTGGAGGFEYGVRKAYHGGFDLIWLMDDDGRPMNSQTLRKLTEKMDSHQLEHKPLILNSIVLCDDENMAFGIGKLKSLKDAVNASKDGILYEEDEVLINPFNGTLISRELVDAIGFPNGQLVIYGDEIDYAARAVKAKAFIATAVDSLYYHPRKGNGKIVLGREIHILNEARWRYYYACRNVTYFFKCESQYIKILKNAAKQTIQIILADNKKMESLGYAWRGIFDGMRGKLGPVVGPMAENDNR